MEFSLVTTDHLVERLWFRDDDDFRVGMNGVAVTAHLMKVDILAFILMSNHVHFVLGASQDQAREFINEYKRLYSAHLHRRYGLKEALRKNGTDVQRVWRSDESLERAIAYVQMNSVAANICLHPSGYPWGTGNTFFKKATLQGRKLGTMSRRAQIKNLKSNVLLSEDMVLENGYIQPESFVQVRFVEDLFITPSRFNYFLVNSSKAKKRLETTSSLPAFQDQLISAAVSDLCRSLYRQHSLDELNWEQQSEIVKQLKRRFSAEIHQLVRVTGIPSPEMAKMLDSL